MVAEVTSEGLATIVQPEARMNGTRSHRIRKGKFQGVIRPTTPMGSRVTRPNMASPRLLKLSPCRLRADACGMFETGDAIVDLAPRLGDGLAVLQRLPIGDLVAAAAQDLGRAQQHGGAGRAGQAGPAGAILESAAGGGDGGVQVVERASRDAGDGRTMRGRGAQEGFTAARRDEGTVDVEAEVARLGRGGKAGAGLVHDILLPSGVAALRVPQMAIWVFRSCGRSGSVSNASCIRASG